MTVSLFLISHAQKYTGKPLLYSRIELWWGMCLYTVYCLTDLTCCSASRLTLNGCALPSSMTCGDQSLVSGLQNIQHTSTLIKNVKQYDNLKEGYKRSLLACMF